MLENKLGLTSSAELAREEEQISKKKAAMLFENHILDNLESGKFSTLQTIHKYLFDEIYDFAGKLRTVNIAKGNFRFAPLQCLRFSTFPQNRKFRQKGTCGLSVMLKTFRFQGCQECDFQKALPPFSY